MCPRWCLGLSVHLNSSLFFPSPKLCYPGNITELPKQLFLKCKIDLKNSIHLAEWYVTGQFVLWNQHRLEVFTQNSSLRHLDFIVEAVCHCVTQDAYSHGKEVDVTERGFVISHIWNDWVKHSEFNSFP